MTSLKELQGMGAFAADGLIKKEIKFENDAGEEVTAIIHVKQLSVGDMENFNRNLTDKQMISAYRISEFVSLGEDGKERIAYKVAYQFKPSLAIAMVNALNEVNGSRPKN